MALLTASAATLGMEIARPVLAVKREIKPEVCPRQSRWIMLRGWSSAEPLETKDARIKGPLVACDFGRDSPSLSRLSSFERIDNTMEKAPPVLAELLAQTIDSFETVELSRKCFAGNHEAKLRLDCLALKLSRWAELVGLSGDIRSQDARFWQSLAFPTSHECKKAHKTLEEIRDSLLYAKDRAAQAEARNPSLRAEIGDSGETNGRAANGSLNSGANELHRALWDVCNQRKCKPAYAQQAVDRRDGKGAKNNNSRWGLYSADEFTFVTNSAVKLLEELADTLPGHGAIQDRMELERRQVRLVEAEVQALASATTENFTLRLLLTLVQNNDDSLLCAAIAKRIQSRPSTASATGSISLHFNDNHGAAIGGNYHNASITNNFGKS